MIVFCNDEAITLAPPHTIEQLAKQLKINLGKVAIAVNGELTHNDWQQPLNMHDQVIVFQATLGG